MHAHIFKTRSYPNARTKKAKNLFLSCICFLPWAIILVFCSCGPLRCFCTSLAIHKPFQAKLSPNTWAAAGWCRALHLMDKINFIVHRKTVRTPN